MQRGKILRELMKVEYGAYLGRILSSIDFPEPPPFGGAIVEIEQGQSVILHSHHEAEIYLILEGKGIMQVKTETFEVSSGDTILIEPFEEHSLRNHQKQMIRMVAIWWELKNHSLANT
ncbi:cupin domain-containing protein [Nostoc sphaeroides]|uniref:Cupin type-2 domain-containing protein n=1 Tax=Nostoc sphaeroides CCNUC1 TaxID=2653204 RepID=A0A5P8WIR9_9NOSO|nr:cupin domain-containing protein [Nostoc sphaeroides]QFS52735.1 hypothetical protein GXM_10490 [Nostoc sphaeroides CCNUC1]